MGELGSLFRVFGFLFSLTSLHPTNYIQVRRKKTKIKIGKRRKKRRRKRREKGKGKGKGYGKGREDNNDMNSNHYSTSFVKLSCSS